MGSRRSGSMLNMSCAGKDYYARHSAGRQRDAEVVGVARDVQSAGKSSAEIAAAQQLSANELDNNVIIIIKRLFPNHPPPARSTPLAPQLHRP